MGQWRHFGRRPTTSGLPLETDIVRIGRHVSMVKEADVDGQIGGICVTLRTDLLRMSRHDLSAIGASVPVVPGTSYKCNAAQTGRRRRSLIACSRDPAEKAAYPKFECVQRLEGEMHQVHSPRLVASASKLAQTKPQLRSEALR
jgi:hypothetical protein